MDSCSIEGCDKPVGGRGLCSTHYQHWRQRPGASKCSVPECEKSIHAKGLCSRHYQRMQDFGSTDAPELPTPEQRFYEFIDTNGPLCHYDISIGPCWLWTGSCNPSGYGQFQPGGNGGKPQPAYAFMYEMVMGRLPPKPLELDHLCSNRKCVRFSHLEPVTHAENSRRSWARGMR